MHTLVKSTLALGLFVGLATLLPEYALATGGITEFSSPLEKVVGTITGPAANG